MISNLDNILFDCIFNYVWLYYIFILILGNTDRLVEIMIVGFILRSAFSICAFAVMMCITERWREERHLGAFLLLYTFYMGYFMRIVRLIGHTEELLFRTSYKDPWNPKKTSDIARIESM